MRPKTNISMVVRSNSTIAVFVSTKNRIISETKVPIPCVRKNVLRSAPKG